MICVSSTSDHLLSKLRELVITALGVNGDPTVMEAARTAFQDHVTGQRAIPSDLRRAVSSFV